MYIYFCLKRKQLCLVISNGKKQISNIYDDKNINKQMLYNLKDYK